MTAMASNGPLLGQKEVAILWAARGFSCGLWVDPPGARWENYVHAEDELLMLLSGSLELVLDGRTLYLQAGQELFIAAGVVHSVRNVGAGECRWLYGYRR